MKVILCEDVDNLGGMGATVKVSPGYARNYLIPRKLAVAAESASAKQVEHEMRIIKRREEKKRATLSEVAKRMESVTITIEMRAGEGDKLFGSVTSTMIAEKLAETGNEVDKRKIKLAEPIKHLGEHEVLIRLMSGLDAKVKVVVTGIYDETPPKAEAEEEDEASEFGGAALDDDEDEDED